MSKNVKRARKLMIAAAVIGNGVVLGNGCANMLFSISPCGTVVPTTICTPADQLNLLFPYLNIPDYRTDPSCTIPFGCGEQGDSDLFPPSGGPGGGASDPPDQSDSGGGTGGGGTGGGGTGT